MEVSSQAGCYFENLQLINKKNFPALNGLILLVNLQLNNCM